MWARIESAGRGRSSAAGIGRCERRVQGCRDLGKLRCYFGVPGRFVLGAEWDSGSLLKWRSKRFGQRRPASKGISQKTVFPSAARTS